MYFRTCIPAAALMASAALAQSPAAHIANGDKASQALNAPLALKHYEAAIAADSNNTQALWKAAMASVVLGEFNDAEQSALYQKGEQYARRALATDSNNADVRAALARALGRIALTLPQTSRTKYATGIYRHTKKCLALNPKHAQCLHILGEWNAQVMRLDPTLRGLAVSFLGAAVLDSATWQDATANMEAAVKLEPNRAIHHLDLGRMYADMGQKGKAKAELTAATKAPVSDYNDKHYKAKALEVLKTLE